jgi:heterodisulfide reductase subunit A-like polyferredoxin
MSSGYIASITAELCEACGACLEYCQFSAIEMEIGWAVIDPAACFGCGVCVDKCPQYAIQLNLDPNKGEPLEIFALMEEASRVS